jgi:chromate transporter
VLHLPFPLIVFVAALLGLLGARLWPDAFAPPPAVAPAAGAVARRRAVIDDHLPAPPHTRPSAARFVRILLVGVALWAVPFAVLVAVRGWSSLHAHEYRFFTLAAFVTFGGAYSVLAYVTQVATTSLGWLTHVQAVDGLALAETTPGPLIMVLQFVGFMAGWNHPEGMTPLASATVGAVVTTYTTFLPCFLFIFLGAPYIEIIRGNARITAALSGVTAAVVGVVLNLALVFGGAVIWPHGYGGGTHWLALAMSAVAFAVLYRLHVDVLWVVLGGGVIGLLLRLLPG